jgi:Na+/melibiose symporter-like transporter
MNTPKIITIIILLVIIAICIIYLETKERNNNEKNRLESEKSKLIERFIDYKYSHHSTTMDFMNKLSKVICSTHPPYYIEYIKRHFTDEQILQLHKYGKIGKTDYQLINALV